VDKRNVNIGTGRKTTARGRLFRCHAAQDSRMSHAASAAKCQGEINQSRRRSIGKTPRAVVVALTVTAVELANGS